MDQFNFLLIFLRRLLIIAVLSLSCDVSIDINNNKDHQQNQMCNGCYNQNVINRYAIEDSQARFNKSVELVAIRCCRVFFAVDTRHNCYTENN